jgi:hypothetical protein
MLKIDQNFFSSKGDNSYTIRKPMSNLVDFCCFQKFYTVSQKNKFFTSALRLIIRIPWT